MGTEDLHHHGAACGLQHSKDGGDQPGHMACGHAQQRPFTGPQLHAKLEMHRGMDDVQMGQRRPFGLACGAGGIEDHRDVIRVQRHGVGQRGLRGQRVKRVGPRHCAANAKAVGQPGQIGGCGQAVGDIHAMHGDLGPALAQDKRQLWRAFADVDRHGNRAKSQTAHHGRDEFPAVRQQQCDAVALFDPTRAQPCGDAAHVQVKLGIGQSGLAADHGLLIGGAGKGGGEHGVQVGGAILEAFDLATVKMGFCLYAIRDRL